MILNNYPQSHNKINLSHKVDFILLNLLILTIPFALVKYYESPTLSQSIYLKLAVIIFILFSVGLKLFYNISFKINLNFLDTAVLLFFTSFIVSSFFAGNTLLCLKNYIFQLVFLIMYFFVQDIKLNETRHKFLNINILIAALLVAIYGIAQYLFGFQILGYSQEEMIGKMQVLSTLGHPNYVGSYLIIVMILSVGYFYFVDNSFKKRLFALVSGGILFLCLIMAGARGAWLGLLVGVIFSLVLFKLSLKTKLFESKLEYKISIAIIFIILFLFSIPNPITKDKFTLTKRLGATAEVRSRFYSWQIAIEMFKNKPLLGMGYGNYDVEYWDYINEFQNKKENQVYDFLLSKLRGSSAQYAHNEYLHFAAEGGLPAITSFFLIIIIFIQYLFLFLKSGFDLRDKKISILISGAILSILIDSIFGFPLHLPISGFYFWMFLGLFNNLYKTNFIFKKEVILLHSSKKEKNKKK